LIFIGALSAIGTQETAGNKNRSGNIAEILRRRVPLALTVD
jgi:hypothetical protein